MEPEELARRLGISGKTLRGWLRRRYPRGPVAHGTRWQLSTTQIAEATARFGGVKPSPPCSRPVHERTPVASTTKNNLHRPGPSASSNRRMAADLYQPDVIRLLLVAEAPPRARERYFYFETVLEHDALFRHVVRGLFGESPDREAKPRWLERLRDAGVFLVDVSEEPEGAVALRSHVPDLVDRCRTLAPQHIILIKATVYDVAFDALRRAGLPVVDQRIPFPGSGQQTRFAIAFKAALAQAGWR